MSLNKWTGETQKFDSHILTNMFLHFEVRRKFCQLYLILSRSRRPELFYQKSVLKNFAKFTGKHLCQFSFLINCNFIKKQAMVQVFPCEFCEISKNTFPCRTLPVTASAYPHLWFQWYELEENFNFVKQPFCGNSSLTYYHIVIYWVKCKIFSGKWSLNMNG